MVRLTAMAHWWEQDRVTVHATAEEAALALADEAKRTGFAARVDGCSVVLVDRFAGFSERTVSTASDGGCSVGPITYPVELRWAHVGAVTVQP